MYVWCVSFALCEERQRNGVFVCLFVLLPASLHSVLLDPTYLWFTFQLCFFPSSVSPPFLLLFFFISCLLFGFSCATKNCTECGNKAVSWRVSPVERDTCCLSCLALCIHLSFPLSDFFFALSVFSFSISTSWVCGCHDPDFILFAVKERKQSLKKRPRQRGYSWNQQIKINELIN